METLTDAFIRETLAACPEIAAEKVRADAELKRAVDARDAKLETTKLQVLWSRPIEDLPSA